MVKVPFKPERTVIAYGSLVPLWDAAGGRTAGIPDLLHHEMIPDHLRHLPRIGSFSSLNLEAVLMLQPDLVILMDRLEHHRTLGDFLERQGIAVLRLAYRNYYDFKEIQHLFALINGTGTSSGIQQQIRQIITSLPEDRQKPRFYVLFASGRGIMVEGSAANTASMAEMLGGINLAGDFETARIPFSLEKIVYDDPDLIFVVSMGDQETVRKKLAAEILNLPAWQNLKAVKNGRVHFLPNELFLYLPGLRYPDAFRMLRDLLYPVWKDGEQKK